MSKYLSDTLFELMTRGFDVELKCTANNKDHLRVYIRKNSFGKYHYFYMQGIREGAVEPTIIRFLNNAAKEIDKEIDRNVREFQTNI